MSLMPTDASISRRRWLHAAGAALAARTAAAQSLQVAGHDAEIQIVSVSPHTFRLTVYPLEEGKPGALADDGSLVATTWPEPVARLRTATPQTITAGDLRIQFLPDRLGFSIQTAAGDKVQFLQIDGATGGLTFDTGSAPLLGLGEGGPQFDRRGSQDRMRSGQGGYQLRTHGGRVPIPWIVGTSGWALFIHQPYGAFDFTGGESHFLPAANSPALPLDLFFVASKEPGTIMAEWARLTGRPELPPLWTFGYQQSHRTLESRQELIDEADTFRSKGLPCDAMIYLGTGFCPSGWNTNNGEFTFNTKVFPDPQKIFDELHARHFKVVLHAVINARSMHGSVADACDSKAPVEQQPSCYWQVHRPVYQLGVDGWWPDEGDPMDAPSRLARNRMYWEAPQLDRPNERPYALHRNGYAGMQRYGSFLWSGDVSSLWETLKTHVPDAINTGLSGIPYWGTDIGGFVPTPELTGELYVRWFQFAAFCPLFRAHGRTWKLRLPWGWNTGDPGPIETNLKPDPAELHNAQVEPICKKYLELRYQLMPYLYSAVKETCETGLPIIRAMWLHYPDDPAAVARGDQYLFGRDLLVAPVVEKGASSRTLYLPRGAWYDFWTREKLEGGREISRPVDLETTPLYVRAGAVLPLDPIRQYTSEPVDGPLTLWAHPGANGRFSLYEDDGQSFDYRSGNFSRIEISWDDRTRRLSLRPAPGSKLRPARRDVVARVAGDSKSKEAVFDGRPLEIRL